MPLTQLDSSPALIVIDLQKLVVGFPLAHPVADVVLVVDAMTDRDADTHRLTVEKIFPRIGETTTTDDVLKRLQEAASVGTNAVVGK